MNKKNNNEKEPEDIESEQNSSQEEELSDPTQLKKELEKAKSLAEDNYGLYLRAVADAENVRKRLIKEVESSKRFALESFLRDVLVVLDGFDKALELESSAEKSHSFFDGVAIVRKQLFEILERNGLQEISAQGKKFDPSLHQAIKRTESPEVSEELVDCEYAKGYKMFDKLLRPAIVSVLVPTTQA